MCVKYSKSLSSATASSGGRNTNIRDQFNNAITAKLSVILQISAVSHPSVLNATSHKQLKTARKLQDPHRTAPTAEALIRQTSQAAHNIFNRYNINSKILVDHNAQCRARNQRSPRSTINKLNFLLSRPLNLRSHKSQPGPRQHLGAPSRQPHDPLAQWQTPSNLFLCYSTIKNCMYNYAPY